MSATVSAQDRRSREAVTNDATFPVTEAFCGMRLDRFLQHMLPKMSRASVQAAIEERVTLASGAEAKASRRLVLGDAVTIGRRANVAAVPDVAVPILASGNGWIVVDKPAGLATTPSARRPDADLATRLAVAPAHRLDRFTSGCLLATRDAVAARWFDRAFARERSRRSTSRSSWGRRARTSSRSMRCSASMGRVA